MQIIDGYSITPISTAKKPKKIDQKHAIRLDAQCHAAFSAPLYENPVTKNAKNAKKREKRGQERYGTWIVSAIFENGLNRNSEKTKIGHLDRFCIMSVVLIFGSELKWSFRTVIMVITILFFSLFPDCNSFVKIRKQT